MEEIKKETVDEHFSITYFNVTPPMSTYILAFVVHDFSHVVAYGENNLTVILNFKKYDL